jgi:3-isopropylmalate dehydratase small subunit
MPTIEGSRTGAPAPGNPPHFASGEDSLMWSPAIRISQASASSTASAVTVDLESQSIVCGELRCQFTIDPARRTRLLNGWDDFDDTNSFREQIDAFKAADRKVRPWAIPSQAP